MNRLAYFGIAAAIAGALWAPAASAQEAHGDMQAQGVINDIIDGLIGNRYHVSDRDAIRRCGWAAVDKAERQYRRYFTGRPPYAYPGYRGHVRVVAITDVQRRRPGVRVRGLLDTARNGWRGRGRGDVSFRCDTDRRGRVQSVQLQPLFRTQ
jgi:hypothetical protein